jgi:hypothetical protein
MAVKLNSEGFEQAKSLIRNGAYVIDDRDAWSEHKPSARSENAYIKAQGFDDYGRWHLGIDDEKAVATKGRYKFIYGDFENVHRCAVLSDESRAGQYKYHDVELATAYLHGMLEGLT